jgi:hypothetical protein
MGILIWKAKATEVTETTKFKKEMTHETKLYLLTLTYLLHAAEFFMRR